MTKKTYWFFLEPYVYVSVKDDQVLLYNTLDASHIVSDNREVCKLVKEIHVPGNGGVGTITSELLDSDAAIRKFVDDTRRYFMGDIIDSKLSDTKPVQILPILNMRAEMLRDDAESYLGDGISTNLRSLTVYTCGGRLHGNEKVSGYFKQIPFPCTGYDSQIPVESLLSFLRRAESVGTASVQLMGGNIFDYEEFDEMMEGLREIDMEFTIGIQYQDVDREALSKITLDNVSVTVYVDFPVDDAQLDRALGVLRDSGLPFKVSFAVTGTDDVEKAGEMITRCGIENCELLPVYTGTNLPFFRDEVFLTVEDILDEPVPMKRIFANQVINSIFWGNLTVTPDGKVHANVNLPPIGGIEDQIGGMLFEEIARGGAWKMIRGGKSCSACVYQYLCPSPSNYEIAIGRDNLCHIGCE